MLYLNNKSGFTLVEILLYLGLISLILVIVYPIVTTMLMNYISFKGSLDLGSELRNIFLRIQKESLNSKNINILTSWEILFTKNNNDKIAIFLTRPIYLNESSSTVNGYASNLAVGSIKFDSDNYGGVYFVSSSSCSIGSSNVPSVYALYGYAWSPKIGWIKFRNDSDEDVSYGVCKDSNGQLRGYAYNDIVGWISFNCLDGGVCGVSNYKVIENNKYLYGYAWNDILGWIIFDGVGGKVYYAELKPYIQRLELISNPRIFVKDLSFSLRNFSTNIYIQLVGPGGTFLDNETVIFR